MSGEIHTTVVGNLTDEPELRFTPSGRPVVNFQLASNPRYQDSQGQWKDAEPSFVRCNAWGQLAENIAASLGKGVRVIATGTFAQRKWETPEGEKRMSWELTATSVGPDLTWVTAKIARMERSSTNQRTAPAATAGDGDVDPWMTNNQRSFGKGDPSTR